MAKFKGQLEDAQLHNKSTDPTNLPDGLVWLNTTDNVAKVYAGGAKRTLVTTDQTQTLTNKTIDADSNTITNIENADIKAGAGIAHSKMAALTASRAMVTDGSGVASASSVTATELGYVSGVTSAIQTQIDSKPTGSAATALWNANKIQGTTVSSSAPTTGQVLKYDGSSWGPSRFASYTTTDVTGNYTVLSTDEFIVVTPASGAVTVTLPDATSNAGRVIGFKLRNSVNGYALNITAAGSDQIDRGLSGTLTLRSNLDTVWLCPSGTMWHVISRDQEMRYTGISTTYTVQDNDEFILASTSGGAYTVTLPQAGTGNVGRVITIKKYTSDTNLLTISTVLSQTIDSVTSYKLNLQHNFIQVISDGSNWRKIGGIETVRARASTAAGATSPANGAQLIVDFSTVEYDSHSAITTGAGVWKFTAPINGTYSVSAMVSWSPNANSYRLGYVRKNAGYVGMLGQKLNDGGANTCLTSSQSVRLLAGDYVYVDVYNFHTSSINLTANAQENWICITRTGEY